MMVNRCNYCTLQAMQKIDVVLHKPAPKPGFPDGVDVYIWHKGDKDPTWAAWFAALSDHCTC